MALLTIDGCSCELAGLELELESTVKTTAADAEREVKWKEVSAAAKDGYQTAQSGYAAYKAVDEAETDDERRHAAQGAILAASALFPPAVPFVAAAIAISEAVWMVLPKAGAGLGNNPYGCTRVDGGLGVLYCGLPPNQELRYEDGPPAWFFGLLARGYSSQDVFDLWLHVMRTTPPAEWVNFVQSKLWPLVVPGSGRPGWEEPDYVRWLDTVLAAAPKPWTTVTQRAARAPTKAFSSLAKPMVFDPSILRRLIVTANESGDVGGGAGGDVGESRMTTAISTAAVVGVVGLAAAGVAGYFAWRKWGRRGRRRR